MDNKELLEKIISYDYIDDMVNKMLAERSQGQIVNDIKSYSSKIVELVNGLSLQNVSQRTYFFDCWKMNGKIDCKEIVATCEEHAILKFEKEFDDYGYDPPYVG